MRKRAWSSGFACGAAAAVGTMLLAGAVPPADATRVARFDRKAFHQALDAVLDRYVEPVDRSALLTRGLKHIVAGLDAHSHFLTAPEREALAPRTTDGATGLAVHLHVRPGGRGRMLEVVGVTPGSAGDRAGVAPGDHILEIDGHDVDRMTSQFEAESRLFGRVDDVVRLRIQRRHEDRSTPVALRLAKPTAAAVTMTTLEVATAAGRPRTVGLVELRAFGHGVGDAFKAKLAQLHRATQREGLAALILDLRGNPGGEVDEALVVADLFIAEGILTRTRGRGGRILREERAHAAGTDAVTPVVVLQNRYTASAAELLTAALHDHGRARTVGEQSYGKGTVQEVMGMPDGSVLKFTVARYFSPLDRKIDGVGLTPDVALPDGRRDEAVDVALALLGLRR